MTTLQRGEDALLRRVKAFDWPRLKLCFAATALCMLLAHGFAWFNLFPSHDGTILFFDADVVMLQLGRWVELLYFRFIRGRVNNPWLNGAFTVFWTSLAMYLASTLLQLGCKATAALCAVFSTAVSVTLLYATYYDKTDLYTCAMFLAFLGVYAVRRCRRPWLGVVLCGGCLCLSMGLYQGYIEFAIGLFLLCLLRDCLTQDLPWADYLRRGFTAVAALLLGGVLYAVSMKAVLAYKHLELIDSYNGLQQMNRSGPEVWLSRLPGAYKQVFATLLGCDVWNNRGMRLATAFCLLLALACLVLALRRKPRRVLAQTAILLMLLPLGLNVVFLLSEKAPTLLMLYPVYLVYVLVLLLTETDTAPRSAAWLACVLCAFLTLENVIYANGAYTYRKLVYENTRGQVYTIMAKVQDLPGYVEGETPVVFSGDFTDSNFTYHNDLLRQYEEGDTGLSGSAITYDGTIKWWFANIMGSGAKVVNTQAELDAWAENPAVQAMSSYPASGCIAMVDGAAVVKLSD
ncbi:glucosyltransferase domain-containing protein [uncultured Gemmiger sp.]|uniref:glucosyltransferase domain-containing protein n=1 Tax=uncultured Gemmiger sp. TaxID=1623490 RepID=UPI0025F5E159|nr:glucosyltransferase domain-containing protein [uncultured Gemmiger sp.]